MLSTKHDLRMWACVFLLLANSTALAQGKLSAYGILMGPRGADAERYSNAGLGFGSRVVVPFARVDKLLAISAGFESVNLLNKNTSFEDRLTGLRVEQQTDQTYNRFLFGAELGPHGKGFFRPFAGAHAAIVYYEIRTDVVVPDDYEREKEIRQNLRRKGHFVFGSDFTLGLDLNFWNKWSIEGGLRYLKSFSLPQQLGEDAVTVHPEYVQFFLGVGFSLKSKAKASRNAGELRERDRKPWEVRSCASFIKTFLQGPDGQSACRQGGSNLFFKKSRKSPRVHPWAKACDDGFRFAQIN